MITLPLINVKITDWIMLKLYTTFFGRLHNTLLPITFSQYQILLFQFSSICFYVVSHICEDWNEYFKHVSRNSNICCSPAVNFENSEDKDIHISTYNPPPPSPIFYTTRKDKILSQFIVKFSLENSLPPTLPEQHKKFLLWSLENHRSLQFRMLPGKMQGFQEEYIFGTTCFVK